MKVSSAKESSSFATYIESVVGEKANNSWNEVLALLKKVAPAINSSIEEVLAIWDLRLLESRGKSNFPNKPTQEDEVDIMSLL